MRKTDGLGSLKENIENRIHQHYKLVLDLNTRVESLYAENDISRREVRIIITHVVFKDGNSD